MLRLLTLAPEFERPPPGPLGAPRTSADFRAGGAASFVWALINTTCDEQVLVVGLGRRLRADEAGGLICIDTEFKSKFRLFQTPG